MIDDIVWPAVQFRGNACDYAIRSGRCDAAVRLSTNCMTSGSRRPEPWLNQVQLVYEIGMYRLSGYGSGQIGDRYFLPDIFAGNMYCKDSLIVLCRLQSVPYKYLNSKQNAATWWCSVIIFLTINTVSRLTSTLSNWNKHQTLRFRWLPDMPQVSGTIPFRPDFKNWKLIFCKKFPYFLH